MSDCLNHKKIILYGAGGHAAVVESALKKLNVEIVGVIDDYAKIETVLVEAKVIGKQQLLENLYSDGFHNIHIAIGSNESRKILYNKLSSIGFSVKEIIHPTAIIEAGVSIDAGTFIAANSVICARVKIGKACIINTSSSVDHDCKIDDFVHVCPGARLAGNVKIGEQTMIGTGAIVIPGITIGKNCLIGAGAVIIRDVPDNSRVIGNPGRIVNKKF